MKNSKLRRVLLLLACAVMLVSLSVGATLAYLSSTTDVAKNTFTVGQVKIKLDEENVDEYGDSIPNANPPRVTENQYHLMPGFEYIKDPTIWIEDGSEKCWVWAKITVSVDEEGDMTALRNQLSYDDTDLIGLSEIVSGGVFTGKTYKLDAADNNKVIWISTDGTIRLEQHVEGDTNVFYVYFLTVQDEDVDNELTLFTKLSVPHDWDNDEIINLNHAKIDIQGYAIQADGFEDVDQAKAAFDGQAAGAEKSVNFSDAANHTQAENNAAGNN